MGEVFRWWRVCVEVTQKRQEMENHVIFSQQTKDKNSKDEVGVEIKTFDWKFLCIKAIGWGHFRVAPRLCFEARLYVKPLYENVFYARAKETHLFKEGLFTWPTTMYSLRAKNQQTGTRTIAFLYRSESRGRVQGVRKPPEMTRSFLIQLCGLLTLKNFC